MKYKFVVQKQDEPKQWPDDRVNRLIGHPWEQDFRNVFDVEISAEEMVEMMQFLWHLSAKRNSEKAPSPNN